MKPSRIASLRQYLETQQKRYGYPIPTSLEDAEQQREAFVENYENICETLRASKLTPHGSGHAVWESRTKLESERLQRRIKWLRQWIRLRKVDLANLTPVSHVNDPVQLLRASYAVLQRSIDAGLQLSNDDRATFELIRSFCTK